MSLLIVIARNYREAVEYLRSQEISPRAPGVHVCNDYRSLRGIVDADVVFVGDWYERPDAIEIEQAVKRCYASGQIRKHQGITPREIIDEEIADNTTSEGRIAFREYLPENILGALNAHGYKVTRREQK